MVKTTETQIEKPRPNGKTDGRTKKGRFSAGNQCARGARQPMAKMRAELQQALAASVTPKDIMGIIKALLKKAKSGDTFAAREVLDRCCGKAEQPISGEIVFNVVDYSTYHGSN